MFVLNVVGYSTITSKVMDGGARIFVECAKRWVKKGVKINVFTCKEVYQLYTNNSLKNVNYILWASFNFHRTGIFLIYLLRTINGAFRAISVSLKNN